MKNLTVCLILLSLSACKPAAESESATAEAVPAKTKSGAAAETAKNESGAAAPATLKPATKSFKAVKLPGTPHDEEHTSVILTWAKKDGVVELAKDVGGTRSATIELKQGDGLKFKDTVVLVTEGSLLTKSKKDAVLSSASEYTPATDALAEATRDEAVTDTDTVWMLKYAGEGTCYMQKNDTVYLANCPNEEFTPDIRAPKAFEWWVLMESKVGKGWLQVDDRIQVKTVSSM